LYIFNTQPVNQPVRKWSSLAYLKGKCQVDYVGVDIGNDPVFTYFDENTAYGNKESIKPLTYATKMSSSEYLDMLTRGPFVGPFQDDNSNTSSGGGDSSKVSSSLSFVRYGGKVKKSPCPRLARDMDAFLIQEAKKNHVNDGDGDGDDFSEASLFMGSIGVASSFHFDLFDNLYTVVVGSKKVLF
jgi:hypothetical protein